MTKRNKNLILSALFLALCVIVPIIFHGFGAGPVFLPMFLPILLTGFLIEFPYAMLVGLLGPFLSALLTGMPPLVPNALLMAMEGVAASGLASYLFFRRRLNLWLCLIAAIAAERLILFLFGFIFAPIFHLPGEWFAFYKLIESMPGILLQLILTPIILNLLWHKNLLQKQDL